MLQGNRSIDEDLGLGFPEGEGKGGKGLDHRNRSWKAEVVTSYGGKTVNGQDGLNPVSARALLKTYNPMLGPFTSQMQT